MQGEIYKHPAQVEFCELLDRARAAGFTPAAVARHLEISKASISKIVSGKQTPRTGTVAALRKMVEGLGTNTYEDMELREEAVTYATKIINLPEKKRDLAKQLIDQLAADEISSGVDRPKVEKIAVESGVNQAVNYAKKRRVAKTSGNKSASAPKSHPGKDSQSPPPTPDPEQHL